MAQVKQEKAGGYVGSLRPSELGVGAFYNPHSGKSLSDLKGRLVSGKARGDDDKAPKTIWSGLHGLYYGAGQDRDSQIMKRGVKSVHLDGKIIDLIEALNNLAQQDSSATTVKVDQASPPVTFIRDYGTTNKPKYPYMKIWVGVDPMKVRGDINIDDITDIVLPGSARQLQNIKERNVLGKARSVWTSGANDKSLIAPMSPSFWKTYDSLLVQGKQPEVKELVAAAFHGGLAKGMVSGGFTGDFDHINGQYPIYGISEKEGKDKVIPYFTKEQKKAMRVAYNESKDPEAARLGYENQLSNMYARAKLLGPDFSNGYLMRKLIALNAFPVGKVPKTPEDTFLPLNFMAHPISVEWADMINTELDRGYNQYLKNSDNKKLYEQTGEIHHQQGTYKLRYNPQSMYGQHVKDGKGIKVAKGEKSNFQGQYNVSMHQPLTLAALKDGRKVVMNSAHRELYDKSGYKGNKPNTVFPTFVGGPDVTMYGFYPNKVHQHSHYRMNKNGTTNPYAYTPAKMGLKAYRASSAARDANHPSWHTAYGNQLAISDQMKRTDTGNLYQFKHEIKKGKNAGKIATSIVNTRGVYGPNKTRVNEATIVLAGGNTGADFYRMAHGVDVAGDSAYAPNGPNAQFYAKANYADQLDMARGGMGYEAVHANYNNVKNKYNIIQGTTKQKAAAAAEAHSQMFDRRGVATAFRQAADIKAQREAEQARRTQAEIDNLVNLAEIDNLVNVGNLYPTKKSKKF